MRVGAFLKHVTTAAIGAVDFARFRLDAQEDARMAQGSAAAVAGDGRRFDMNGFGLFGHGWIRRLEIAASCLAFPSNPFNASKNRLRIAAMTTSAASLPDLAVEISGLNKTYRSRKGSKTALVDFSLQIPRGSFFGLLGPNGAGKSTLINIMAGLVAKSSGTVKIWDYDFAKAERQARLAIGVVPQELNLDPFFTPRELLEVQAGLYGVPKHERRTDEILEVVGLADRANAYARALSGGMRRRLLIAKALVHTPPIIVLDEPTAGVDVGLRQHLWKHMRQLNATGTTILLTTHYLEEAEELCDRIAIIDHGRLVACDTKRNLLRRLDNKSVTFILSEPLTEVPEALRRFHATQPSPTELHIAYRPSSSVMREILDVARACNLPIADMRTEEVELEDIFLQLTSRAPGEAVEG